METKTLIKRGLRIWKIIYVIKSSRFEHRRLRERLEKEAESIELILWERAKRAIYEDCVRFARNYGENQFKRASWWRDAIVESIDFDVYNGEYELGWYATKSGNPHIISW